MIELAKANAAISCPVDIAFQFVSNMENYGSWFPGVRAIKSKNSSAHGSVGKTYIETLLFPDGEYELTIEVAECETNHLFLTKGDLEGVLPQMTIEFHTQGENSCHMNLQYYSRNTHLTQESDIIVSLREDLAKRALQGMVNLQKILGHEQEAKSI